MSQSGPAAVSSWLPPLLAVSWPEEQEFSSSGRGSMFLLGDTLKPQANPISTTSFNIQSNPPIYKGNVTDNLVATYPGGPTKVLRFSHWPDWSIVHNQIQQIGFDRGLLLRSQTKRASKNPPMAAASTPIPCRSSR
jgi:hypothetical protein